MGFSFISLVGNADNIFNLSNSSYGRLGMAGSASAKSESWRKHYGYNFDSSGNKPISAHLE
jgi:hypothetical protein